MNAVILVSPRVEKLVYPPEIQSGIRELAENISVLYTDNFQTQSATLQEADVLFGGWGMPMMDTSFLALVPRVKAVFYGAGTIKAFTPDAFWQKGIIISSAYAANAVPVAEFTFAQIILSLKNVWPATLQIRQNSAFPKDRTCIGAYGSTVGLVSLGMIGKMVLEKLRTLDVKVIAYDPFVTPEQASEMGIELCSLEDLFQRADVVSLHTPWLKEAENLIRGSHFNSMKSLATFINTSRGAVVNEEEMIGALKLRPDLTALLDVTWPEPPVAGSPLYTLPNVFLTPHIAGSVEGECARMGRYMLEEFRRYSRGEPLKWQISREMSTRMA
jgi:phosphoglycerate dehydrogenase-like enzyme